MQVSVTVVTTAKDFAPPIGERAVLAQACGLVTAAPAAAHGVCSRTASDAFVACHPFLEVDFEDGEIVQLVECNVDPLCDSLPLP